jgi:hypothetical protein
MVRLITSHAARCTIRHGVGSHADPSTIASCLRVASLRNTSALVELRSDGLPVDVSPVAAIGLQFPAPDLALIIDSYEAPGAVS